MNNPTDLKLYELLGNGRTKFEPDGGGYDYEEVPDEPTIADLHKWLNQEGCSWKQKMYYICVAPDFLFGIDKIISYKSSLPLLNQEDSTKLAIIELITNHS